MDKKELLKRWALAYTEPSLFYVPWKEYNSDDEYFTVTLIPHVNYYDVFDEKVIKNATLYDIYSKGFTKEQQNVYGGLHDKIRGESNVYIAKDLNGNIVASSTTHDYMSVAKKQAEQIIQEAEGNARKSVDDLGQEILMKKKELEDIKKQFDVYKAKMESLLISQLELLKDINKDDE